MFNTKNVQAKTKMLWNEILLYLLEGLMRVLEFVNKISFNIAVLAQEGSFWALNKQIATSEMLFGSSSEAEPSTQ